MGQEKAEAFSESMTAMAAEVLKWNFETARRWMIAFWGNGNPWSFMLVSPWRPGLPLVPAIPAVSAAQVSAGARRVLEKGLAPVHRRATANARRLRRVKPR